jgi:hypothetical protein
MNDLCERFGADNERFKPERFRVAADNGANRQEEEHP